MADRGHELGGRAAPLGGGASTRAALGVDRRRQRRRHLQRRRGRAGRRRARRVAHLAVGPRLLVEECTDAAHPPVELGRGPARRHRRKRRRQRHVRSMRHGGAHDGVEGPTRCLCRGQRRRARHAGGWAAHRAAHHLIEGGARTGGRGSRDRRQRRWHRRLWAWDRRQRRRDGRRRRWRWRWRAVPGGPAAAVRAFRPDVVVAARGALQRRVGRKSRRARRQRRQAWWKRRRA